MTSMLCGCYQIEGNSYDSTNVLASVLGARHMLTHQKIHPRSRSLVDRYCPACMPRPPLCTMLLRPGNHFNINFSQEFDCLCISILGV